MNKRKLNLLALQGNLVSDKIPMVFTNLLHLQRHPKRKNTQALKVDNSTGLVGFRATIVEHNDQLQFIFFAQATNHLDLILAMNFIEKIFNLHGMIDHSSRMKIITSLDHLGHDWLCVEVSEYRKVTSKLIIIPIVGILFGFKHRQLDQLFLDEWWQSKVDLCLRKNR